jgi:hypothetical protein
LIGTVVDELSLPLAVTADPDTIPLRLLVHSLLATELLYPVLDIVEDGADESTNSVTDVVQSVAEVTKRVVRLCGGSGGLGAGGSGLLLGGGRRGLGLSLVVGNLSDLGGSRRSRSRSRGGEDGAPVDIAQIVCDLAPVNFVGSAALDLTAKN